MTEFSSTETSKLLEELYGDEYKQLDDSSRERFYTNLNYDTVLSVKRRVTQRIGYGVNAFTVNDEAFDCLNRREFRDFSELAAAIMQKYLKTEVESCAADGGANSAVSAASADPAVSALEGAFQRFKKQLPELVLPPQGVNFACVRGTQFGLPQAIELRSLLCLIAESRARSFVKHIFPTQIEIPNAAQRPTLEDGGVEITPLEFKVVEKPSISCQHCDDAECMKRLARLRTELRVFLLTDALEMAKTTAEQQQKRVFAVLEQHDSLARFVPHCDDWDVEVDEGMTGGWVVLNGPLDWSQDVFADGAWETMLQITERFCEQLDQRVAALIEQCMGHELASGWLAK